MNREEKMDFEWLMKLADGYRISKTFFVANELDIFSQLAQGLNTLPELSTKLGVAEKGLAVLLNALVALQLVEKKEAGYYNSVLAETYLVKGKTGYQGGIFRHIHNAWFGWSQLEETLRLGHHPTDSFYQQLKVSEEWLCDFVWGMEHLSTEAAKNVVPYLELDRVKRLLDLGCGAGTYAATFIQAYPQLEAFLFDRPHILEITKKILAQKGLLQRIKLITGDFKEDDFGDGYDFVWLSFVVHICGADNLLTLLQRIYRSLTPGGSIGLHDFFLTDDKTSPFSSAIFAVHTLAVTTEGRVYSHKEIASMLTAAGFAAPRVVNRITPRTDLVLAKK